MALTARGVWDYLMGAPTSREQALSWAVGASCRIIDVDGADIEFVQTGPGGSRTAWVSVRDEETAQAALARLAAYHEAHPDDGLALVVETIEPRPHSDLALDVYRFDGHALTRVS